MTDPTDTFSLYLDETTPEDQRLPDPQRPALVFQFGTAGALKKHEERLAALGQFSGADYLDELEKCASFQLVEIRNCKTPDGEQAESLSDFMTVRDMRAMAHQFCLVSELSEPDRKKSESQSPSAAASSAPTATSEKESVSIRQQPQNHT